MPCSSEVPSEVPPAAPSSKRIRSNRLAGLTSAVFAEMDQAKRRAQARGLDVINLSVGSPDLPPAPHVIEALKSGVSDTGNYGYPMRDHPAFRQAIAAWYGRRFGVELDPETEITGLSGSQDGLAHLAMAFCDPGDLVMVPDPGYPIYSAGPLLSGARLYPLPLRAENQFLPDLEAVPGEIWRRAKVWLINYPSNPLSATAEIDFFAKVVDYAQRYGLIVCHDAAYSELAFDGYRPPSFLQTPGAREIGLEFNSLSKTFNLAGCRVGYAVGNREIVGVLAEAKSHLDFGVFKPVQGAAVAALTGPQDSVAAMARTYQDRRNALVSGLASVGWEIPRPKATMFCWAPLPKGWISSYQFAQELVEKTGVAIVPGVGFGALGEGYVRIALVQETPRIEEAVRRIAASGLIGTVGT